MSNQPLPYDEVVRRLAAAEAERDRLHDTERDLRRAQALSQTGSWRIDLKNHTISGSAEARRIYGIEGETWPLAVVQAIPVPEHRPRLDRALERLVQHGVPYDVVFQIRRPSDGALREIHSVADYDAADHVVLGTIQDITERRRAEARIALLSEMLNDVPTSVTVYDEQGVCLYASRMTARLHGYEHEDEFQQLSLHQINVPESAGKIAERMARIARDGFARFEVEHYRKDGSTFPLEVLTRRIDWEGRPALLGVSTDISERKRAERSQRHVHELLQYVIEHSNASVAIHDRDLRYVYVSQRYLDAYKVRERDVIGKHHYDVFPDLPQKWRDVHQRALAGEVCGADRDPYPREDGSLEWTRWGCRPWYAADGSIGGIIVYSEVITDQVRAEETLRQQGALLARSQAIANVGSWVREMASGALSWTDETYRIFGVSPESFAVTVDGFYALVHPDDRAIVNEAFGSAVRDGRDEWQVEHRILRPTGEQRTVHERCVFERNADGAIVRAEGTVQDITARKQTEAALRQFKTVFDTANFGAAIATPDGRLQYVNRRFAEDHGYTVEELLGHSLEVLHAPEQLETVRQSLVQTEAAGGFGPAEIGHRHRDGSTFPMLMTGSAIRDGQGRIEAMAATAIDLRGQKKLEAQLAQAQKMESIGRLAGGVAHDFNNMLSVIMGYAGLALERVAPDDQLADFLQGIHGAAKRSAEVTQQLLAFARRQTIAPKVLDLNETIEGMLRMLRRLIGEDIDLAWMPATTLPSVLMDPSQVNQVLANLCVNARDAIDGVGRITIETDAVVVDEAFCASHPGYLPGHFVTLAVSDNGCGMDRDTLDKLFEPFFTTKDVNKGTGLGLATVYGIVKQNHGFVNVYSEVGQGSTFRMYLPAHAATADVAELESPSAPPRARGGETILLVEDEPAVLKLGATMLELLGYGVLAAPSPARALDMARAHEGPIHLLMTDVVMPEMNGRELARRLDGIRPGVRKLYTSGYTANVIAHHGVLDEGVEFIHKPFSMKDLAVKVRRVLDA